MSEHVLHGNEQEDHSHAHPSEAVYIKIALILVAITSLEVAIYYIQWFHDSGALVPMLAILSIVKFVTVVAYYMHLKFDPSHRPSESGARRCTAISPRSMSVRSRAYWGPSFASEASPRMALPFSEHAK